MTQKQKCHKCGSIVSKGTKYCSKCGYDLDTSIDEGFVWRDIFLFGLYGLLFCLVINGIVHGGFGYLWLIIILFPIRLHPIKGRKRFKDRIKNFKKQKIKYYLSIGVLAFSILISIGSAITMLVNDRRENKIAIEKQRTSIPTIKILNNDKNNYVDISNNSGYNLIISVSGANNLYLDDQLLDLSGDIYSVFLGASYFKEPITILNIKASNKYYDSSLKLTIGRDKSNEELEEDKLKEEQELEESKRREEKKVVEKEKKDNHFLERIKNETNGIIKFNGSLYRDSVDSLTLEVAMFGTWALVLEEGKNYDNSAISKQLSTMKSKLQTLQAKEFPAMRRNYAKAADSLLREFDLDAYSKGSYADTLELKGYLFASNRNIKDVHIILKDMLKLLRFGRANYKRTTYGEYTYYDIDSYGDREIVVLK